MTDLNLINNPCELAFSSMNLLIGRMLIKAGSLEQKHTKLARFCKIDITDVHRLEAVYLAKYEWTKAEEERIAKEKAEAEAAAAEENA